MSSKLIRATATRLQSIESQKAEELPPPPAVITIDAPATEEPAPIEFPAELMEEATPAEDLAKTLATARARLAKLQKKAKAEAKPAEHDTRPVIEVSTKAEQAYRAMLCQNLKEIPACTAFNIVANTCGFAKRGDEQTREAFTKSKPIVRELVMAGLMELFHSQRDKFYYYRLRDGKNVNNGCEAQPAGRGRFLFTNGEDPKGVHALAGQILASRVFRVNKAHARECYEHLIKGECYHNEQWISAPTAEDQLPMQTADNYDEQRKLYERFTAQHRALHKLIEFMKRYPSGMSFNVKCDWRGRFYYLGGLASPHAGKMMRFIFTQDDETTLDHRSSFAQMNTLINGDTSLGLLCGIGTTEECDIYAGVLQMLGIPYNHHWQRSAVKYYIMPQSYGASRKCCERSSIAHAMEEGATREEAEALAKALKDFDALDNLKTRTQSKAQELADVNRQMNWTTPSGFIVMPRYWMTELVEWNSHAEERGIFPASLTIRKAVYKDGHKLVETRNLDSKGNEVKSAVVASTANVVQSFDASCLALTVVKFFAMTGEVPYTIHDSYTISKTNADKIPEILRDTFADMQESKALEHLRDLLEIPNRWINYHQIPMNPMDIEA